ncbi:acetate--CoA ligase family protein [Pusillimonas sp. MFBS29]|uniref:acetate--CoA ligase family protein n=1 Tax=Pusillimonas sp. MFBS29 TaxID=2886690 RepID=UPI001D1209E2|nr:acetate--CoA ligase family protein [Pusillimonas sp. MFBS29]MCC2596165.1 acetate--CoA ligase family protein [Pusillimonas sp. MFBS29]
MTEPRTILSRHDVLARMLQPQSVAVIGASAQFSKINGRPLKHLLEKGYQGRIYPVNPKYSELGGLSCYPDAASLPEPPDLAVIAVPAKDVPASLRELGMAGGRAAVVFSSGFGEIGAEGLEQEQLLRTIAQEYDMVLCGPNCLGFINAHENVYATFSQYADGPTNSGPIGFVTQSGAFGTAIAALVRQRGLGLGYFINTGNEADAGFSELMSIVVEDPRTRVVAGYLEGIKDVEALARLTRRCHELGKPLVLTKVGRTASGVRAAASHTGSLAVEDALFDSVLRQYGVLRARNEEQMLDMLEALAGCDVPAGRGLGIITQSGGAGVMMTDRAEEIGLDVPVLQPSTSTALQAVMPAYGSSGNPVDITGQFVAQPELLSESVSILLDDPGVDIGIVWLQLMTMHVDMLVDIFGRIREQAKKPFIVCWVAAPPGTAERLREKGIVMFGAGERAVDAVAALARYGQMQRAHAAARADAPVPLPIKLPFADGPLPTLDAVALLEQAGVPMAPVALAASADDAVQAWKRFGKPVALKIESPDILHKTDVGGVVLGLDSEADIRKGYQALLDACMQARPDAAITGIVVQPMSAGHVELVIGVKRDPVFGVMVMVGYGGILLEVLRDVAFRRAPFSVGEARTMLDELRMRPVLDGVRGRPPIDVDRLCMMLSRLSLWAVSVENQLQELDLNPVLAGPEGPVGVDSVVVLRTETQQI